MADTVRGHADDLYDAREARVEALERLDMAEAWQAEVDRMYVESQADFDELRRLAFREYMDAKEALDALPRPKVKL